MAFDLEKLNTFSDCPGVYLMKGSGQKVIYIGKAKNLKKRLKQYFLKSGDKRPIIPLLQQEVLEIETLVVDSEVEALLLESSLIKKYKPKYNAIFRDDKSYCKLKMSTEDKWPRLYSIRKKSFSKEKGKLFGPFVNSFAAKQTLEVINKLYPLRECSDSELGSRKRPCILFEIGRCLAPCVNKCSEEEYTKWVHKAIKVLSGSDDSLLEELKKSMEQASDALEFERAAQYLELIKQVEKTVSKQYVDLGLDYDIHALAIYREGGQAVLTLLPFIHGKMQRADTFFVSALQSNEELIPSFITQYYQEHFIVPEEFLLFDEIGNIELLESYFLKKFNKKCRFSVPKQRKKKKLVDLALSNAQEAYLSKSKQEKINATLILELQSKLKLVSLPRKIVCYDISHLSQSYPVASMVVFKDGEPDKNAYRKYKIDPKIAGDDYAAMKEVLTRSLKRAKEEGTEFPDLLIVDGGKGQLKQAKQVLTDLSIDSIDLAALVKEKGRHDKGMSLERVILPQQASPISFSKKERSLLFLQKVRDEAHRFAIDYQRQRMSSESIKSSLWEIPGIGRTKAQALLQHFGSVKNILKASPDDILAVPKISKKDLSNILAFIQQEL